MMEYFAPVALHQDLQVSAAIKIVIVGKQFALKVPWDHGWQNSFCFVLFYFILFLHL